MRRREAKQGWLMAADKLRRSWLQHRAVRAWRAGLAYNLFVRSQLATAVQRRDRRRAAACLRAWLQAVHAAHRLLHGLNVLSGAQHHHRHLTLRYSPSE